MNYAIPPMTPAEFLTLISTGGEHDFFYCSQGYDSCSCAMDLADILLGQPGLHDQPEEYAPPRYKSIHEKHISDAVSLWGQKWMDEAFAISLFGRTQVR